MLLSPTRNGLQSMFNICVSYFKEHKITIITNIDIQKSKTKCIYFSHTKNNVNLACILLNDTPLPWVKTWPHLENDLERNGLSFKTGSNMNADVDTKRRKFIGKFHAIRQEFEFASSEVLFNLINIYATSFYGSVLWDLRGSAANSLFTIWNYQIRTIRKLPNTAHRYLIEEISESMHLKAILSQRYLGFVQSLLVSKKKCLSELAKKMVYDQGSTCGQNINYIAENAGFSRYSVLKISPRHVASSMKYSVVPEESMWKVSFLKELLSIRDGHFSVGNEEEGGFSRDEIQELINIITTD